MEIREMVMRIPGIGKHEAGQIAQAVSRALAQQAWRWPHGGSIGDLHLQIEAGNHHSHEALVANIVKAMVNAIDAKSTSKTATY
jgi:hypothetical protein